MILRTEAIVLRAFDYGETSQIVTLFTRDRGKVSVLAKGARLTKSRFGSTLQPMSYVQVVFYYKSTRTLQTLTESTHVQRFPGIGGALDRIAIGLRIVELVQALLPDEEENALVFRLLLEVLDRLDQGTGYTANLLPYFQLRLAGVLGFAPSIDRAEVEALGDQGLLLLESGTILSGSHPSGAYERASRAALRAFAILARADLDAVLRLHLTPPLDRVVLDLVETYLRYHLEDAYPTRSEAILAQLRPPSEE